MYALPDPSQQMMSFGMPMAQMMAVAPAPAMIDPTNLFVKGLDPLSSSQDLFAAFKPYGRIVSARVNETKPNSLLSPVCSSRMTRAEDAAAAQQAMHGQPLAGSNSTSQPITVRFHEPKKQRISSYGGGKRPYGMPREREASFDSVQNLSEDINRRVRGISPTGVSLLAYWACTSI
jgi:RNA recognition motif-containing protein